MLLKYVVFLSLKGESRRGIEGVSGGCGNVVNP